jgi:hypothetical protein
MNKTFALSLSTYPAKIFSNFCKTNTNYSLKTQNPDEAGLHFTVPKSWLLSKFYIVSQSSTGT